MYDIGGGGGRGRGRQRRLNHLRNDGIFIFSSYGSDLVFFFLNPVCFPCPPQPFSSLHPSLPPSLPPRHHRPPRSRRHNLHSRTHIPGCSTLGLSVHHRRSYLYQDGEALPSLRRAPPPLRNFVRSLSPPLFSCPPFPSSLLLSPSPHAVPKGALRSFF